MKEQRSDGRRWRVAIPGGGAVVTNDEDHAYEVRDQIPGSKVSRAVDGAEPDA